MEAMTMPYKLNDASILSELHPGDVITADVLVSPDPDASYLLDHIVRCGAGQAGLTTSRLVPCPNAPGRRGARFSSCATRTGGRFILASSRASR